MKRDYASAVEPWPSDKAMPAMRALVGHSTMVPDEPSPVVACTADEDKARQEHALSSQIGYQIQRFGVGHPVAFGEVDFDNMDLTKAMELIQDSALAWQRLPKVIRDRYHGWAAVEAAAASGELEQVLKAAGASPPVGEVPGASASDSAPVA